MKKILLIMIACMFCFACGVKSDPEYKSQDYIDKTIKIA